MTQPEKQKMLQECIDKLKRAAHFAESLRGQPVVAGNISSLWALSSEAHCAVTATRSVAAGNPEPKVG